MSGVSCTRGSAQGWHDYPSIRSLHVKRDIVSVSEVIVSNLRTDSVTLGVIGL